LTRDEPGGASPSAATSAQAVDAPRVQELRAAREQALADLGELARTLDEERAEADKARRSHKVAKARADERVKALAVLQQPTPAQWDQLNRAIAREDDLEAELRAVETRVQDITESLRSQESRVQQLERALALAMAQARTPGVEAGTVAQG
jgi:chromosome segregation ATPase